jgi:class 3 adenylate cyclase
MSGDFRRRVEGLLGFPDDNWEFLSETFTRIAGGWGDDDAARRGAALLRVSTNAANFRRVLAEFVTWDVSSDLQSVQARTLVLHPQYHPVCDLADSRTLAAAIPRARLVILDAPDADQERRQHDRAVADFLRVAPDLVPKRHSTTGASAIILFADIADSTGLTERLGDEGFRDRARALEAELRRVIGGAAGTVVEGKLLGDGLLATFRAASPAIDAALRCSATGFAQGLLLHIGLHAGDVIRERDNVFGGAVNIAARISALSTPGEVLVSRTVADLARTSSEVSFMDRGEHTLKGIAEPQRLFAVQPHS